MRIIIRIIVLASILIAPAWVGAFTVPAKPTSYVLDAANILDANVEADLEQNLRTFEKETSVEIAVVTIPSLDGDTVENIAQEIFTAWGIGKKEKNNGALLLVSMQDRKMRIHTGYGLEPTLTDITAYHIEQEHIVPAFKNGNYAQGIVDGVNAMESVVRDPSLASSYQDTDTTPQDQYIYYFFFGALVIQWLAAIFARSKSWWAGGILGLVLGGINFAYSLVSTILFVNIMIIIGAVGFGFLFDYFVSRNYQKRKSMGHVLPWWIGGRGPGSGGSSGGFGGFGGGSSGGGGASSGW